MANISTVVSSFKRMDDKERFIALKDLLEEKTFDPKELDWRSRLCTALEKASVYPKASYDLTDLLFEDEDEEV